MAECPTCAGNSEIGDLYREYHLLVHDLGSMQHAKNLLRTAFSKGDKWTKLDDAIGKCMDSLDVAIDRHMERVIEAKQKHKFAIDLANDIREAAKKEEVTA